MGASRSVTPNFADAAPRGPQVSNARYADPSPLPGYDPVTRTWHTPDERPDLWPRDANGKLLCSL